MTVLIKLTCDNNRDYDFFIYQRTYCSEYQISMTVRDMMICNARMDTYFFYRKNATQIYCCKNELHYFENNHSLITWNTGSEKNVFFLIFLIFNSSEPKVQVSFSDHPLSVVRPSVCSFVCPSVRSFVRLFTF